MQRDTNGQSMHQAAMQDQTVIAMLEHVLGCKWSLRLLALVREGMCRPGAMKRQLTGLSTKVQHACLTKMVGFGILERQAYAEIPPRVEYRLTDFGARFVGILDAISALQQEIKNNRSE